MARKQIMFRLDDEHHKALEELALIMGMSRNEVVANLIKSEYDRISGNKELKKLISKMNELRDQLENYGKTEIKGQTTISEIE